MDDLSKHIKFFTGSLIQIQRLQLDLDDNEIPSLVKNNFQSGLRSGFYGGSPSLVELFIFEEDKEKATPILEKFKEVMGI
ncbi:MAG: DUF2007 domain-containing protein [Flavobacteriaceae bacterium]|nr:DUF2007 domain-containing protein [Flavobacteriaceae bacterium]